jgi:hypothetical protein
MACTKANSRTFGSFGGRLSGWHKSIHHRAVAHPSPAVLLETLDTKLKRPYIVPHGCCGLSATFTLKGTARSPEKESVECPGGSPNAVADESRNLSTTSCGVLKVKLTGINCCYDCLGTAFYCQSTVAIADLHTLARMKRHCACNDR